MVPAYPIFLLTILQTIETNTPHELGGSSFGHYYDCLITHSLDKIHLKHDDIDAYKNYITFLAFYIFKNRTKEISHEHFIQFHDQHCEDYSLSLSFNQVARHLVDSNILENHTGKYFFKYNYIFYFFVGRYLANHITDSKCREIVSKMCKRLHREEFANIIMFITHHTTCI